MMDFAIKRAGVPWMTALLLLTTFSINSCKSNKEMYYTELQLTFDQSGHTIHNTQVFSPDDQWIVFDSRNDENKIGSTNSVGMVNLRTRKIKLLYQTQNQTEYGPGVGAVTFSPNKDKVLFIHGIRNASKENPYGFTRRTGVVIDIKEPFKPIFMDARDIVPPFTPGALRGGTHAHTWSGDGEWISFTYNDYVIERLSKTDSGIKDLRTIGVMFPRDVEVKPDSTMEMHSGKMFSVLVVPVKENPKPGTDEIDKAFDEGWIGRQGYLRPDGSRHKKAIAFQGNTRDTDGKLITEVFVADLPDDLTQPASGPIEGTINSRPNVPRGVVIRRITHTKSGLLGPRFWLRTTPDGSLIGFLSVDDNGIIQLFGISPNGGDVKQLTYNEHPIQGPFNFSPDSKWVAYCSDNSVLMTSLETGESMRITPRRSDAEKPIGAPVFSHDGTMLAYNRCVVQKEKLFVQIFVLKKK